MNPVERVVEGAIDRALDRVMPSSGPDPDEAREELQQARARALASSATNTDPDDGHDDSRGSDPQGSKEAIESLQADEDCDVCTQLLAQVKTMDEPRRTKGVAEYGEFRRAVDDSEEAAQKVLTNSEVLIDAVNSIRGA